MAPSSCVNHAGHRGHRRPGWLVGKRVFLQERPRCRGHLMTGALLDAHRGPSSGLLFELCGDNDPWCEAESVLLKHLKSLRREYHCRTLVTVKCHLAVKTTKRRWRSPQSVSGEEGGVCQPGGCLEYLQTSGLSQPRPGNSERHCVPMRVYLFCWQPLGGLQAACTCEKSS